MTEPKESASEPPSTTMPVAPEVAAAPVHLEAPHSSRWRAFLARYQIGGEVSPLAAAGLGFLGMLVIVAIWFVLTWGAEVQQRFISPYILPSPVEVARQYPPLVMERNLMTGIEYSLRRVVLGFALAALVGYPLGILMGTHRIIKALFNWIMSFGRFVPIAALVPICLLLFGATETEKVMFLFIGTVFYLVPAVEETIAKVPREIIQTAETLGVHGARLIWKVIIPYAKPDLFMHGVIMFGIGWTYIILAEIIDAKYGLGYIIAISQRRGPTEHVYGTLLIIMAIGLAMDLVLKRLHRWRYRWVY